MKKYLAKTDRQTIICDMPLEHEPSMPISPHTKNSPAVLASVRAFGLAIILSLQPETADAQIYFGDAKNELRTQDFKNNLFDAEMIIGNKFTNQFASLEKQANGKIPSILVQNLQKEVAVLAIELEELVRIRRAMYANSRNADLSEATRAKNLKEKSEKLKEFLLPHCTIQALEGMIVYKQMNASMFQKLENLHVAYAKPDAYKKEIAQRALQELRSVEAESPDALRESLIKKLGCMISADAVTDARKKFLDDEYRYWTCEFANSKETK